VLEPDVALRGAIVGTLRSLGAVASGVGTIGECLEESNARPFGLVLFDLDAPGLDVVALAGALRQGAGAATGAVPRLVGLLGEAIEVAERAVATRAVDDLLARPFDRAGLRTVLERAAAAEAGPRDPAPAAVPPQPPDASSALLDPRPLEELRSLSAPGTQDFLSRAIGSYLESAPRLIDALVRGARERDASSVMHAAHTLKSSSAFLGARNLAEVCRELERMGRAQDLSQADELVRKVCDSFGPVRDALLAF
jgi:two-component system sensor histidine kinase/response regulator